MNYIGIQFLINSVSVAYFYQGKLIGKTIEVDHEITDSEYVSYIDSILDELSINRNKKYNIIFSVPHELVEIATLKELVPIVNKKLSKSKREQLIKGQLENLLNVNIEEVTLEYTFLNKKELYDQKMLVTAIMINREDALSYYHKVKSVKGFLPHALDVDAEALRRLLPKEEKDSIIIHFFKDKNDMVGIYIYKDEKLIGVRYLVSSLYDSESLEQEIDRMIVYSKTFYRRFNVKKWYVFGNEENVKKLGNEEMIENHPLMTCPFAVSAGLAVKYDYNKKGGAKKHGL